MRNRRLLVDLYLSFIALIALFYGLVNERIATGYTTGDWLINYEDGFVRRGLPGQAIWLVAKATGLSLPRVVLAVQLACYAIFLYAVWKLVRRSSLPWWALFLLASPATVAFLVFSHHAGFRKEILFYAALAVLALLVQRGISPARLTLFLSVAFPILILSHEALFFYLPYFGALVFIAVGNYRTAVRILLVPACLAVLAFAAAIHFHGDGRQAAAICDSFGQQELRLRPNLCGGDVSSLGTSSAAAHQDAATTAASDDYAARYGITALLAFAPVVAAFLTLGKEQRTRSKLRIVAALTVLSILGSVALFTVAVDWGRWLTIHTTSLLIVLLVLSERQDSLAPRAAQSKPWRPALLYVALLLYATCWNVPFYGLAPYTGYIGLVRSLHHHDR